MEAMSDVRIMWVMIDCAAKLWCFLWYGVIYYECCMSFLYELQTKKEVKTQKLRYIFLVVRRDIYFCVV